MYFFATFSPFFLLLLNILSKDKFKSLFLLLIISFYIFVDGFKYELGTDWINYYNYYTGISPDQRFEVGFKAYVSLFNLLELDYYFFIFITSFFIVTLNLLPIYFLSNKSLLAVIYAGSILLWYMGSMRQFIASGFLMISIFFILKNRFFLYSFFIFIGSLFHISILILFPIYFIYKKNFKNFFILYIIAILLSLFPIYLLEIFNTVSDFFINKKFDHRIGGYADQSNPVLGFFRKLFSFSIPFYYYYLISQKLSDKSFYMINLRFFLHISLLTFIFYYLGLYVFATFSSRMDFYSIVLFFSVLLGLLERKLSIQGKLLLSLFAFILTIISIIRMKEFSLFIPYSSIFYNYDFNRELY